MDCAGEGVPAICACSVATAALLSLALAALVAFTAAVTAAASLRAAASVIRKGPANDAKTRHMMGLQSQEMRV